VGAAGARRADSLLHAAAATGALPSLGAVAPLLVRLNAFSDERLDESNYEVQSVALRELSELRRRAT
jgi:hypothetical protein